VGDWLRLIDLEEDKTLKAVIWGLLMEMERMYDVRRVINPGP
jgi:hypothetical protein